MQKIKKVEAIEVKRCFVISDMMKPRWYENFFPFLKKDFAQKLESVKGKILILSSDELDKLIAGKHKKRLKAYDSADWYLGEFETNEVGTWQGAGGMSYSWTEGNLVYTAEKFKKGCGNLRFVFTRAGGAVYGVLKTKFDFQSESYLLPIAFTSGFGTNGRRKLHTKTKFDIDDGNMRAVAFAIKGAKTIKAYIGFPKV